LNSNEKFGANGGRLNHRALDQEGKWLANEPKLMYQDKLAIGMMARAEAITLYQQAGYGIRFTDREQLLFEIADDIQRLS
jgi:hypothetical protein